MRFDVKTANGFAFPAQVLLYGSSKKPLARAVRDVVHPDMWRLVLPDGRTSGPANLTRIKDTGLVIAERGPPRRDSHGLHWESLPEAHRRVFGEQATPSPHRAIAPTSGDMATDPTFLAEKTGLSLDQIELGLELMKTGRSDLIAEVIAGRMSAAAALIAAKRSLADA
jgi:hypothetical protein